MKQLIKTLAVLAALGSSSAFAVSITLGNVEATNRENVLFSGPGTDQTGNPVVGRLNTSGLLAEFFSPEILESPANGAARVTGDDGNVQVMTLQLAVGETFRYLQFNPRLENQQDDGFITYTVNFEGGIPPSEIQVFAIGNGNNRVTILAEGTEEIQSVSLSSTVQLSDVRQVRYGITLTPTPTSVVPDGGATIAMLGAGILGLAGFRKFRR